MYGNKKINVLIKVIVVFIIISCVLISFNIYSSGTTQEDIEKIIQEGTVDVGHDYWMRIDILSPIILIYCIIDLIFIYILKKDKSDKTKKLQKVLFITLIILLLLRFLIIGIGLLTNDIDTQIFDGQWFGMLSQVPFTSILANGFNVLHIIFDILIFILFIIKAVKNIDKKLKDIGILIILILAVIILKLFFFESIMMVDEYINNTKYNNALPIAIIVAIFTLVANIKIYSYLLDNKKEGN